MGIQTNPELLVPDNELVDGVFREGDELPPDRTELFRTDGFVYTVPTDIQPNLVFGYLRDLRREGPEMAAAILMEKVIGPSVMDVLADHSTMTAEEFAQVYRAIQKYTMGSADRMIKSTDRPRR
jgi:hypothetical protein